MSKTPKKPDLRDRDGKGRPHVTPTNTDVKFAGAENRNVVPGSGSSAPTPATRSKARPAKADSSNPENPARRPAARVFET